MKITPRIPVVTLTSTTSTGTSPGARKQGPAAWGKTPSAPSVFGPWQDQLNAAPQILVALSGGLDSMVLLHLLMGTVPVGRISVVHVNHGLSPNADQWQASVEAYCQSLKLQLQVERVQVVVAGEGIEAAARSARYAVFERLLQKDGLLLLGHHGDDQVETVLYHLMRGSGAKGLAGMPVERALGLGRLVRPLLSLSKSDLQAYGQAQKLSSVEDESNAESIFDRNYLRNEVIPVIADRWPDYRQAIQLSAQHSSEASQLAEVLAHEDLLKLELREERAGWSICIDSLSQLSPLRQRNILRHWPSVYSWAMPNNKLITEIMDSLIRVRKDAQPALVWQSTQWRRFHGRLYLLSFRGGSNFTGEQHDSWAMQQPLRLIDGSHLMAQEIVGEGLFLESEQAVTIRYRQGGERCKPAGRGHSNSLKKLFLEHLIEPWWRDRMPLLYVGETLVAVGDCWVCEGWQAQAGQRGKKIRWQANSL